MDHQRQPLFTSLRDAAQQARGATKQANRSNVTTTSMTVDPQARREIEQWWAKAGFRVHQDEIVNKSEYARLYRRIVIAMALQLPTLSSVKPPSIDVDKWIDEDWRHDQRTLTNTTSRNLDELVDAIATLAQLSSSSESIHSFLANLQQPQDGDEARALPISTATETATEPNNKKKPITMAEKLAQMRSSRSSFVSQEAATKKATQAAAPSSPLTVGGDADGDDGDAICMEINVSAMPASSSSTSSNTLSTNPTSTSTSSHDDASSHYFAIETRLELHDALRMMQKRLDLLLLPTKLAWMKCFALEANDNNHHEIEPTSSYAMEDALQIVTQGEALAAHLLDAFTKAKASSASCAIAEFKSLVALCGEKMDAFQALVLALAAARSPIKNKNKTKAKKERQKEMGGEEQEEQEDMAGALVQETTTAKTHRHTHQLQQQPPVVVFDLPSMKNYYDRAAPSYASYLPKKK